MLKSNANLDLAIFGLEGTLVDTREHVIEAHKGTLEWYSMGAYRDSYIFNHLRDAGIENGLELMTCGTRSETELGNMNAFFEAVKSESRKRQAEGELVTPRQRWIWSKKGAILDSSVPTEPVPYETIRFYEDAPEIVEQLAHIAVPLAIITPVPRQQFESDFALCGEETKSFFDMSITGDDARDPLTDVTSIAASMNNLLRVFNAYRRRVAIVSSNPNDILAANTVHIKHTIGVSHGYATAYALSEAGAIVCDSLEEAHDRMLKEAEQR